MKFMTAIACLLMVTSAQAQSLKAKKAASADAEKEKTDIEGIKKNCGCAPKFTFNWGEFKTEEDYLMPGRLRSSVSSALEDLCKDAEGKKAVCGKLKTVVGKLGASKDPTFSGGTLTIVRTTNESQGDVHAVLENGL